jgi:hypothetical protein
VTASVAAKPGAVTWLILSYRLPANRGLKVTIRRRLTAIGAVFPVHAVAVLPASPPAERAFRRTRRIIGEAGGSAQVLRAEVLEGAPHLAETFNKAREQEYAEIIAGCGKLLAGIKALKAPGQFRYSDLADREEDLNRLTTRNDAIRTRDSLGAANAGPALSALDSCRAVLDDFAACVYQTDSDPITGVVHRPRASQAP